MSVRLFISYEPDQRMVSERLTDWTLANPPLDEYDARSTAPPDSPASAAIRGKITEAIASADVLVCPIGQTTFLDKWVDWEIRTFLAKPERHGIIGLMLHDLNTPPQAMIDHGSIYIKFKKDKFETAVEAAMAMTNSDEDFVIED